MILSAEATEIVIEKIHEYLINLGEAVRKGLKPLDDYIIFKVRMRSPSLSFSSAIADPPPPTSQRLGKNPEDYPDAKSLPHVQVAMKMKAKGQSAKSGDVIPYIFCKPASGETTKTAQAANAHSPDDVRRQGSTLAIGAFFPLLPSLSPLERR